MCTIATLDTTLRDGAQAEGVNFTIEDKRRIAIVLDDLGVDIIEGGNPAANPKDRALFGNPPKLRHASFAAFGSTARYDADAANDPAMNALLEAKTDTVVLFGKSSLFHVGNVLRVSGERNLLMIEDSIRRLSSAGRTVHFDAEHFFDGYKDDPEYAIETLRAAAKGGARSVALCDTNGGALPWEIGGAVSRASKEIGLPIGIHCHNDAGCATANTLSAVASGASIVHGTMGGIGERCGNADLCAVLPALSLKMGMRISCTDRLSFLTSAARTIADIANLEVPRRNPYVGISAFAHKGGVHVDGVRKAARSYEHIDPALVGNERRLLVSDQAGRSALLDKLHDAAPDLSREDPVLAAIADQMKERERYGYVYEGAEGSFKLMALRLMGRAQPHFEALDFHVFSSKPWTGGSTQAYIKIHVSGEVEITAAEGEGPVAALDSALRKALCVFYPQLDGVRLVDFKVRVIDSGGTGSTVRVTIESTDGVKTWGTVGVSRNIIEACWTALTDAFEFKLSGLAEC